MSSNPPDLPKEGTMVELWFSGYNEYYPGRVEALDPPDYFTVVLDDGSSWPVDRVNNIWKFREDGAPRNAAEQVENKTPGGVDVDPDSGLKGRRRVTGRALRKSTGGNASFSKPVVSSGGEEEGKGKRKGRPRKEDTVGIRKVDAVGVRRSGRVASSGEKRVRVIDGNVGAVKRRKEQLNGHKDEAGVEQLSTQAVTAIAVDAALASAKAVFRPLGDRLGKLRKELSLIEGEVKTSYLGIEKLTSANVGQGELVESGAVSKRSLEMLLVDLSELIGGGEARIRAYEKMSDGEFGEFKKILTDNAKALGDFEKVISQRREKATSGGEGNVNVNVNGNGDGNGNGNGNGTLKGKRGGRK